MHAQIPRNRSTSGTVSRYCAAAQRTSLGISDISPGGQVVT